MQLEEFMDTNIPTLIEEIIHVWPVFLFVLAIIAFWWNLNHKISLLSEDHKDIKRMLSEFQQFAIKLGDQHNEHDIIQHKMLGMLEIIEREQPRKRK